MKKYIFILNLFIMWSIFGCGGKKKVASNEVGVWLEKNFPQQFDIIKNEYAVNTWTSLDRSKFRILLALKSDADIQFTIPWNTGLVDGGTSTDYVKEALAYAKEDVGHARDLLAAFRKNGIQKVSVGFIETREGHEVDVWFYNNPMPNQREEWFVLLQNTLKEWNLSSMTNFWVCFMEEDYYGKDFKDIVPAQFVHEWQSGKQDNCIFWIETDWKQDMNNSKFKSRFSVNLSSQRALNEYGIDAFTLATAWAKVNIKHPTYLRESSTTSELNSTDPMAIDYCIPYFKNAEAAAAEPKYEEKIDGYICGTYQVDQKMFKNVKRKDDIQ